MKSFTDCRFLVVDDIFAMRTMVAHVLKQCGAANITEAGNGPSALEMIRTAEAKNAPFHFVLCDWNMPEMLGIDLLRWCKANDKLKSTSFIFVTAETESGNFFEAKAAGADKLLPKPLTVDSCAQALAEIFERKFKDE